LRIVGGEARGRPLRAVPGSTTRPTADRVRQSLFDLLGQRMDGLAVLDLYAGTGAMALEALSRGATSAVLIEADARACAAIFHNVATLGYENRVEVLRADLPGAFARIHGRRFGLVFSDPPYALKAAQATLAALIDHQLLAPGARMVLEMGRDEPTPAPLEPASLLDERRYGDTRVAVFGTA
jgi:16S rRNA (guanine966-N2)-methyltransferase